MPMENVKSPPTPTGNVVSLDKFSALSVWREMKKLKIVGVDFSSGFPVDIPTHSYHF